MASPVAPNCVTEADVRACEADAHAGMTVRALEDNYGHHRPTHQARARKALG
jgi:hypothetical protein